MSWPDGLRFRPLRPEDWPGPRATRYKYDPFNSTLTSTQALLARELRAVKATDVVIQLELSESQIRLDGLPRADARPARPSVILSFTHPTVGPLRYPCERFDRWPSNLRAIALGLEALRKVERYGITTDHQQYRGWRAIESTVVPGDLSLDQAKIAIQRYAQADGSLWDREPEVIRLAVRRAKSHSHPDHPRGRGSAEAFHQVSLAETRLRAEGVIA